MPNFFLPVKRILRAIIQPGLGLQVIGIAALMALLGGGVVGLVTADRGRAALRDNILSNSLATADLAAALSASYIDDAQAAARELASRPTLRAAASNGDLSSVNLYLERWSVEHPNVFLFISDLDGVKQATGLTDKSTLGQYRAAEDWFLGATNTGQPFLGAPSVSPITGKPRLPYGVPLRDEAGGEYSSRASNSTHCRASSRRPMLAKTHGPVSPIWNGELSWQTSMRRVSSRRCRVRTAPYSVCRPATGA